MEVDSVSGTIPGEEGKGLGPTFNANSCAACHAQPAVGGSSPAINPQVAQATLHGARNTIPSFISVKGPVREARFISTSPGNTSAPLDGGVHGLFTIAGRSDASGCSLGQPDFATALTQRNVIFRIPTPLFGLGLVENTPDSALQANLSANSSQKSALGIRGELNVAGNDGTVSRFGWKAQNKSLLIFAGEAYNVEQGVSNEVFTNERSAVNNCIYNPSPEDHTNITNPDISSSTTGTANEMSSDIINFAVFMRLTASPKATTHTNSEIHGQSLFTSVGCYLCHSPSLTSGKSPYTGMSNQGYAPFSDFALHHMGSTLSDGIVQGYAGADEFRTAPLWGLGQRLFFLHDGRTSDLLQAIQNHFSPGGICDTQRSINGAVTASSFGQTCGSEANAVINNFNALRSSDKQDLLNFLRSL